MAFSLAASMIAGQAVSAAPAAEAASESALQTQADSKSNTNASYTDPWTKTAVPNQAAKVTSDVDKTKFTHKEWTGETYTDVDGNQVKAADVYGINTKISIKPTTKQRRTTGKQICSFLAAGRDRDLIFLSIPM